MITVPMDLGVWFCPTSPPRPEHTNLDALAERMQGRIMLGGTLPPGVAEQYRHLAARLHQAGQGSSACVVMVASAMPGEGKTLTATNIALTLSESYKRRVIIIDADLRRPSMHEVFAVPNTYGVNDLLMGHSPPPAFEISPRLSVIPAGRPNPDPIGGLTSPVFEALIKAASEKYDWVIVDTPPVGLLTDANLMLRVVDAVVMVVAANEVGYKTLQRAADSLGRERIIGVVLNRAPAASFGPGYGYHEYYGGYGPGARK